MIKILRNRRLRLIMRCLMRIRWELPPMGISCLIMCLIVIPKKMIYLPPLLRTLVYIRLVSIRECWGNWYVWAIKTQFLTLSKLLRSSGKAAKFNKRKCRYIFLVKSYSSLRLTAHSPINSLTSWQLARMMYLNSALNASSSCLQRILWQAEKSTMRSSRDSDNRKEFPDWDIWPLWTYSLWPREDSLDK